MKQDNVQSRIDKGWDKMHVTLDHKLPQRKKRRAILWWILGVGITVAILLYILTHTMTIEDNSISEIKHQLAKISPVESDFKAGSSSNNTKVSEINKVGLSTHTDNKETFSKLVTRNNKDQNSKTLKPIISEEKESIPFNSNNRNQFLLQSKTHEISNNRDKNINEDSAFINIKNDTPQQMPEEIGNPKISTQSTKHILPIHLLNVQGNSIESDVHYSIGNPINLSPTKVTINSNKNSPVSTSFTFGMGTDYLYKPKAFGLSPSIGINISKSRFSLNAKASYTRTFNKSSESGSPAGVLSSADVLSIAEINLDSTVNVIETMNSESPHYISIGINLQYELGRRLSIIGGFGREFHLGSQVFNTFSDPAVMSNTIDETITVDHRNTNYLESGINYSITPRLSLEANYRYVINSYLDISNDETNKDSAKVSFNIIYILRSSL